MSAPTREGNDPSAKAQASPAQASPAQASPAQASPAQASPAQASPAQASPAQAATMPAGEGPETSAVTGQAPGESARPHKGGASGAAAGVLAFVAALGGGFFVGKWVVHRDGAKVQIERGDRYRVELRGDEPQKGPDDALVTIIEFADFECPFCAKGSVPMMKAADAFDDDVRVIFKHYPLPFHSRAIPAARAAHAAHQYGKFWEMHDYLYDRKGDVSDIRGLVATWGIDPDEFTKKMFDEAADAVMDQDMIAGGKVGVTGTPAYIVNGRPYSGARSETGQWKQIIEAELADAERLVDSGVPRDRLYAKLMEDARDVRGDGSPVGGKPSTREPSRRAGEPLPDVAYKVSADDRPGLGPVDALVTVVEFSDFQCPYCRRSASLGRQLVDKHTDVRVVFRHLPLQQHSRAREAAKAAIAAGRQGKFWEMHDKLFADPSGLAAVDFTDLARELGLSVEQLEADMGDPAVDRIIDEDIALARRFGVSSTPTTFVNGRYLRGAQTLESLEAVIEQERKKAEQLVAAGVPRDAVFAKIMETAADAVEN